MSNILIVGCGRVGSELANKLSSSKNNISVIDNRPEMFRRLGQNFNGNKVLGVGYDQEVLLRAGIEDANVVLAVTNDDNANLMVCEVCNRIFEIDHVVARLHNLSHERTYTQLGIDYVCGTRLVTAQLYDKAISRHGSQAHHFGDYEIIQFSLDLSWASENQIKAVELQNENVRIISYLRANSQENSVVNKDTLLYNGDTVLACVKSSELEQFQKYILD